MSKSRGGVLATASCVLALLLLLLPSSPAHAKRVHAEGFVSLGDSYSSGEGVRPFDLGTDVSDGRKRLNRCHRNATAWPRLVGTTADAHLACSGAVIDNLYRGQERNAPDTVGQIDRLRTLYSAGLASTVLVTLGGNDVGFSSILFACRFRPLGCLRHLDQVELARLSALRPRLVQAYRDIAAAAVGARIIVVGYPAIFPRPEEKYRRCGWISNKEKVRLGRLTAAVETTLAAAAAEANVEFISLLQSLRHHELCTRDSWVVPITPRNARWDQRQAHPIPAGQTAMANTVISYLNAHPQ
jgi:hypothetical protein